ncbi:hypothetical protein L596_022848 [Steinernema carpocapsae]|uniref:Aminotransferase class I/classII large domain-containing protein n=1 Tax=Steinernema carpocapsae TaxID=34508 RepID=A0A4U5MN08_STECR|nr:hypothetical protein L596_022848 [Steinernema carpocapsae]
MIGLIFYLTERLNALFLFVYGPPPKPLGAPLVEDPPTDPKQTPEESKADLIRNRFCCQNCRVETESTRRRSSPPNSIPSWVSFFANWKNKKNGSTSTPSTQATNLKSRKKRSKNNSSYWKKGAAEVAFVEPDGPIMADRIATRAQRLLVGAENATAAYKEVYVDQWHPIDNPQGKINLCTAENNLCDDLLHEKRQTPIASKQMKRGSPTIRTKEAAKRYLEQFHAASSLRTDFMILTPGCTAAYDMLSFCLCEPGDVVLAAAPFYGRLFNNFEERGQAVVHPVSYENIMTPRLDVGLFQEKVKQLEEEGKLVKVIVVINPNNPLGVVFPKGQIIDLCRWASGKDIHVIIDEVFASSVYDHAGQFDSFLSYRNQVDTDRVSYLWGFSKDLCLPGLKFSLVYAESEHLVKSLRRLEIMQPCAPCVQHIAEVLLEDLDWLKTFHEEKNARLLKNKNFLCAMLNKLRIDYVPCTAAFTVYVDLRRFLVDSSYSSELQLWLELCGSGVFISPGQFMGGAEPGWFRIVFSGDRNALVEGLHRFESALSKLSTKKRSIPLLPRIDTNPLLSSKVVPSLQDSAQTSTSSSTRSKPEPSAPLTLKPLKREISDWDFGESSVNLEVPEVPEVPETSDVHSESELLDIHTPSKKKRVSWVDIEGIANSLEAASAKASEILCVQNIDEESDPTYLVRVTKVSEPRRPSIDANFIARLLETPKEDESKDAEDKEDAKVEEEVEETDSEPKQEENLLSIVFKQTKGSSEPSKDLAEDVPKRNVTIAEVQEFDHTYIDQFILKNQDGEEAKKVEEVKVEVVKIEVDPEKPVTRQAGIDTSFIAGIVGNSTNEENQEKKFGSGIALDNVFKPKPTTMRETDGAKDEEAQLDEDLSKPSQLQKLEKPEHRQKISLQLEPCQPTIDTSFVAGLISVPMQRQD